MALAGETVESFDAYKQAAFRTAVAATLGVDAERVTLEVRGVGRESSFAGAHGSAGSGAYGSYPGRRLSGAGIEIVVTVRADSATVATAQTVLEAPSSEA